LTTIEAVGCFRGLSTRTPICELLGFEYKEDLASGSLAAAAGGYVAVVAMANTEPVVDSGPLAAWILKEAEDKAVVRIGQVGSISKSLKGEELSEMRELADAGVVAFSDDGKPVADAELLLQALRYARGTERPLLLHLENTSLSADGVMHEGKWSARLGLRGIPSTAEAGPLARDLEVVRYAYAEGKRIVASRGASDSGTAEPQACAVPLVHFQHLSAAESVRLVRQAKAEGLPITAEVTPAHLLLTDERLCGFDQNLKVNPPVRSGEDREALVAAIADGTIDCVGTDHAPHAPQEKEVPIEDALFGSTGLETAFAALHTGLVLTGAVTLGRLVEAMSGAPCRVLGLEEPRLAVGAPADFCVVDLQETWTVAPAELRGKSRNCAFLGETFTGRVRLTVVDGARRYARAR
jgi:dihydroorotase